MLHMMSTYHESCGKKSRQKMHHNSDVFLPMPSIQTIVVQLIREVRLPLVGILKHSG
jgi:hypothetical protein